jgi:hypothetical protein
LLISSALAANNVVSTGSNGGAIALLVILGSVAVFWLVYSLQKKLRKHTAGHEEENE